MKYITSQYIILLLAFIALPFIIFAQNKPETQTRSIVTPRQNPSAFADGNRINYVRTWEPSMETGDPLYVSDPARSAAQVKQSTSYFDGLGREIQTVVKQITPQNKDQVRLHTFDEFGREAFKYLSYGATGGSGDFRLDPFQEQEDVLGQHYEGEQIFYSQGVFEPSPINRVLNTYSQGNNWALNGGNRPVENRVLANTYNDDVIAWRMDGTMTVPVKLDIYHEGLLMKKSVKNEQGLRVQEFVDQHNQVILKRTEEVLGAADGHTGWLNTYYVYDERYNLRFVIPPKAVAALQLHNWDFNADANIAGELCFQYKFDARRRMVEKKLPGADPVFIVYDANDNQAFVQDGNHRQQGKWIANFYDGIGRPVMTALYTPSPDYTREQLQNYVNTFSESRVFYHTIPGPADLIVANRSVISPPYKARNSVILEEGFETNPNEETEILIDPNYIISTEEIVTNSSLGMSDSQLEPLVYSYYDQYPISADPYISSYESNLTSGGNDFADPQPQAIYTIGFTTVVKVKVIGTDQWLSTTSYYDKKGRTLQLIKDNISGGKDVITNRYNHSDELISSYVHHKNIRSGSRPVTKILKEIKYDPAGRITKVTEQLNDDPLLKRVLSESEYNELGQMSVKKLGQQKDINGQLLTDPLESLTFKYHVRGWISSINKNYVNPPNGQSQTDNWFGMELSFDHGFTNNQFSGNVAGVMWRSKGDGEKRAYGYEYDNANRIARADFTQFTNSAWNTTANVDYSVSGDGTVNVPGRTLQNTIRYDQNGNLLKMTENGLKLSASQVIDNLTYTYQKNGISNKLLAVEDAGGDNKLGDFNNYNTTTDDYDYDRNGNLLYDKNKRITSITYNHLNLPDLITFEGKGTIQYRYSAQGDKLQKIVRENGKPVITTDYIGDFVYKNNALQLIRHDEGRIRNVHQYNQISGQYEDVFVYDYFVRDYIGNIRMVLTEEKKQALYAATNEVALQAKENQLFANYYPEALPVGYPTDNTTSPNEYVTKLNSNDPDKRVGTSLILKVMAGDKINIAGKYFYKSQGYNSNRDVNTSQLLTQLIQAFGGTGSGPGGKYAVGERNGAVFNGSSYPSNIDAVRNNDPSNNNGDKPKAYLNFMLFDEQFKMVDNNSGIRQTKGGADILNSFDPVSMSVGKNGYLYVYLSNESPMNVYFDNLMVSHESGPLVEETHYYPFGLTMTGISSEALGKLDNKIGFNANELQSKEFEDGSGLDLYDFNARIYDQQLGRFLNNDPLSEKAYEFTGYRYGFNNPAAFSDPSGMYEVTLNRGDEGFDDLLNSLYDGSFTRDFGDPPTKKNYSGSISLNVIGPGPIGGFGAAYEGMLTIYAAYNVNNAYSKGGLANFAKPDYWRAVGNDFTPYDRDFAARGGWFGLAIYKLFGGAAAGAGVAQIAKPTTIARPYAWPYGIPIGIPFTGHGNSKDNSNPHLVYEIFKPNAFGMGFTVMKYGISDLIKLGPDRPEVQILKITLLEGALVEWRPLLFTPNRQSGLDAEEAFRESFYTQHGFYPPYNNERNHKNK